MVRDSKVQVITFLLIVIFLLGICIYKYTLLAYGLQSVYDEGFFYITSLFINDIVVSTQPLSLSIDMIDALIPDIKQYDVLTLRQYAYLAKSISFLMLLFCSCIFLHKCYSEKRFSIYLALIASTLLIANRLLPSLVFNMNDIMLVLVTCAFSLCLLFSSFQNVSLRYCVALLIGIISWFTLICNLPAGCMLIVLCGVFMLLYGGFSVKKMKCVILFGLVGIIIGVGITHFFIISLSDCYVFLQKGIIQTTSGGRASHHSLTRVILVIFFGLRDLAITTFLLCGITYITKFLHKLHRKGWLTILFSVVCFFIAYKWQVKPQIYITSVLCWLTIIFLKYHIKLNTLSRNEIIIICISFIMPICLGFGTNTNILSKALSCGSVWSLLIFLFYYKSQPEVRKYFICGIIIIAYVLLHDFDFNLQNQEELHFTKAEPIATMNLTANQKAFYDEVYDVLSDNGYNMGVDTLLGFCFNEMTIVAMDAKPYTNDQQPEEFLLHDLSIVPAPKYMILSEWDSIVLYNRFSELEWDFPNGYRYYKCKSNPDPNSGYNMTQSIIYCKE